jgi:hypothetical protein
MIFWAERQQAARKKKDFQVSNVAWHDVIAIDSMLSPESVGFFLVPCSSEH